MGIIMKIFIDTAVTEEVKEAASWGIIDGVTTNPSLVARSGRVFDEVAKELFELLPHGAISLEVISTEADDMVREARRLAEYGPNAVIKIPLIAEGLKATRQLTELGIKTNVTLCFSPSQALLAAKAGATYISPFVGRLDDISHEGMQTAAQIVEILENYDYLQSQVIVASVRHPQHVVDAALMGAHVATVPFKVLQQMVRHPLTDSGLEAFLKDWETVPKGDG